MPGHNGDYSPEAEHERELNRARVQRKRIRARIRENRATAEEIAAIETFDDGGEWKYPGYQDVPHGQDGQSQQGQETNKGNLWVPLGVAGGLVAVLVLIARWKP